MKLKLKQVVHLAAIATVALFGGAVPSHAQTGAFDDFFNGMDDLIRANQRQALSNQISQAFDAQNLVHAVTTPRGDNLWVNSSSVYYEGGKVFFVQIQPVGNQGFIRTFVHGDCSSGMMGHDAIEGWDVYNGLVATEGGSQEIYFAPGSYGRQVLDTACEY